MTVRASTSCWVQPAGMASAAAADGDGAAAEAVTDAATDGAAETASEGDGDAAAMAFDGRGGKDQPALAVDVQAASVAASRPPPVRAAPRRKPRRLSDGTSGRVSGARMSMPASCRRARSHRT